MSTNGIIIVDLGGRNAAELDNVKVDGSFNKAAGAYQAGTFITVYKWNYQGFNMNPSVCTVEFDSTNGWYILKDKFLGGELIIKPNDLVYLDGGSTPSPEVRNFKAYHVYSGSIVEPYTMMVQNGHFTGYEFNPYWTPSDFVPDGEAVEITADSVSAMPFILQGCLAISYATGWFLKATDFAHEYSPSLEQWSYFHTNTILEQLDRNIMWSGKYYCEN